MRKFMFGLVLGALISCCPMVQAKKTENTKPIVKVENESNDDYNITHRKGTLLIEKSVGKVLDNKGNGRDSLGYYISYKGIKGATKGKTVETYCIFNPNNNYCDDIIYRYDIVK